MPSDNNIFCATIQEKLNAQQIRQDNVIGPDQGTLAYLVSSENRSANAFDAQILDTKDGKYHTGRARFLPRGTKAEYDTPPDTNICVAGDPLGYFYDPFTIDQTFTSVKLTFSYNEMRSFCEGKEDHIAEVIHSRMHAYRSVLNKRIVQRLIAGGYIGNFANGVAGPKSLPLFHTADNKINPVGEITIEQDMTDAEIAGMKPRLIGANLLQSYATMKGIQCCNHDGYNAGLLDQIDGWFLDKTWDEVLGTQSNILAFIPGAIQLLTYNKNKGAFAILMEDHTHTTISDTLLPGLTYDLYTHLVKCNANRDITYQVQWELNWDIWGYPEELFQATDELFGVTDLFHYVGECSDDNVCALAAQTPAPVAAFTQSFAAPNLTLNGTSSAAQAPGATLVNYTWNLGGTTGTISGAPGATITGVTGVTGTYAQPVINTTTADIAAVGEEICLKVVDSNLRDSATFCDIRTA